MRLLHALTCMTHAWLALRLQWWSDWHADKAKAMLREKGQ